MKTPITDTVSIAARRAHVMYENRPHVSERVHQVIVTAVVAAEVWHWERQLMERSRAKANTTPALVSNTHATNIRDDLDALMNEGADLVDAAFSAGIGEEGLA